MKILSEFAPLSMSVKLAPIEFFANVGILNFRFR